MYYNQLGDMAGLTCPVVPKYALSSYKDFCVFVDPERFGMDRDQPMARLDKDNMQTKRYF